MCVLLCIIYVRTTPKEKVNGAICHCFPVDENPFSAWSRVFSYPFFRAQNNLEKCCPFLEFRLKIRNTTSDYVKKIIKRN